MVKEDQSLINAPCVLLTTSNKDVSKNDSQQQNFKLPPNNLFENEKKIMQEQKKKEEIDMLINLLEDVNQEIVKSALFKMTDDLKSALSSLVSIPFTLKFLRQNFSKLETLYEKSVLSEENNKILADLLSVICTTFQTRSKKALSYSLVGTGEDLTTWGEEYTRNISREIIDEYRNRQQAFFNNKDKSCSQDESIVFNTEDLMSKIEKIVPYYIEHHNDIDAIDLLIEVQQYELILKFVDNTNYKRVTKYLLALAQYLLYEDDYTIILGVVFDIFINVNELCEATRIALKLRDSDRLMRIINDCVDPVVKKQIGFILGSHRWSFPDNELNQLIVPEIAYGFMNQWLSKYYRLLAKDLDVEASKTPQDVYKCNIDDKRRSGICLDSAKQNLSSTIVNGFINTGYGHDSLMTASDNEWLYKNKDNGMTNAVASLGMSKLDKYQWSSDPFIKAGALMAFGLLSSGVKTESDIAFTLLNEELESEASHTEITIGTLLGLTFCHITSPREKLLDKLIPMIIDTNLSNQISAFSALLLSVSYLGTGNELVSEAIIQTLVDRQGIPGNLESPLSFFYGLSLGLLYLGCHDLCESVCESLNTVIDHPIGKYTKCCINAFAYVGSGDTTRVQNFMKIINRDVDTSYENQNDIGEAVEKKNSDWNADDNQDSNKGSKNPSSEKNANERSTDTSSVFDEIEQTSVCLAIAVILVGQDIGTSMILRMFGHMLQYGSLSVRKGIPLALALLSSSSPKPSIIEVLSKLSHDSNTDVANNAIFALGIVGAGTNNARIAQLLRQLAIHYSKSTNTLFIVRIAQGILYLGKGLLTISTTHSDGLLFHYPALCSLLILLHSSLFMKNTILGHYHYLLYFIVAGARPKMILTVNEQLDILPVTIRLGQALDTAGSAGNPRSITAFQTQTTPILLGANERAELATNEYTLVNELPLEDIVILKSSEELSNKS